jgi:hypothetical protein
MTAGSRLAATSKYIMRLLHGLATDLSDRVVTDVVISWPREHVSFDYLGCPAPQGPQPKNVAPDRHVRESTEPNERQQAGPRVGVIRSFFDIAVEES